MDVTLEKTVEGTRIKTAQAHPTWVSRVEKGTFSPKGHPLYTYQTLILENSRSKNIQSHTGNNISPHLIVLDRDRKSVV